MPRSIAAGCLVVAEFGGERRFLVVHPSGWYNKKKPYSIPKGLVERNESHDQAALRETREETGLACRILAPLGEIDYRKSRKTVVGFLAEPVTPPASTTIASTDWEIDRAEFLPAEEARARLHPDQRPFIDRALERLAERGRR